MSVCSAKFKISELFISNLLHDIEDHFEDCSVEELKELNEYGYLPTGIMNYIIACRVKIS